MIAQRWQTKVGISAISSIVSQSKAIHCWVPQLTLSHLGALPLLHHPAWSQDE